MRTSIKTILEHYQVRKTPKQKQAFRTYLEGHAKEHGYDVHRQKYGKHGQNLIIGDPEQAKLILTAHYDTPPNFFMPLVASVGGIIPWTISQFIPVIPILAVLAIPRIFIRNPLMSGIVSELLLIGYAIQMMAGIPNKHNANDNTSGVSLLVSLLEELPKEERDKVCFIFFDEEEKGLIGSGKFKKAYKERIKDVPLINFDCIANGKHFVFSAKKGFRQSVAHSKLQEALATLPEDRSYSYGTAWQHIYTSDQLHFKNSVGVAAAHDLPVAGPVLHRIHTGLDTKFDEGNIEELARLMVDLIGRL